MLALTRAEPRSGHAAVAALLAGAILLGASGVARAQDDPPDDDHRQLIPGIDEWAQAVAGSGPRWEGPTVPWPEPGERPAAAGRLQSTFAPVAVHGGRDVTAERMHGALEA